MDSSPPLLTASYRDALRGITVARYSDNFENDITAIRAALLSLTFAKPVRFKFRAVSHVVMPWCPQAVGHLGASIAPCAEPEEQFSLSGPTQPGSAQLLITSDAASSDASLGEDDEVFEIEITTPMPAAVLVRAPSKEAARALLRNRWDVLEQDALQAMEDRGYRRRDGAPPIDIDDVEIVAIYTRPDLEIERFPVLYR